jgi:hypothetical protein
VIEPFSLHLNGDACSPVDTHVFRIRENAFSECRTSLKRTDAFGAELATRKRVRFEVRYDEHHRVLVVV